MIAKKYRVRYRIKIVLLVVTLFALFLTIRNLTTSGQEGSMIFVLDISHSMNVRDIQGSTWFISRLDLAKSLITQTLTSDPERPYGLIIFSHAARYEVPPTLDTNTFVTYLSGLTTAFLPGGGTAIAEWIALAEQYTSPDDTTVLLTDGGEGRLTGSDIITGHLAIIGIGSDRGGQVVYSDGSPVTSGKQTIISRLNRDGLTDLAHWSADLTFIDSISAIKNLIPSSTHFLTSSPTTRTSLIALLSILSL